MPFGKKILRINHNYVPIDPVHVVYTVRFCQLPQCVLMLRGQCQALNRLLNLLVNVQVIVTVALVVSHPLNNTQIQYEN